MFRFDCVHITERLPGLGDGSDPSAEKGLHPYLLQYTCTHLVHVCIAMGGLPPYLLSKYYTPSAFSVLKLVFTVH